MMKYIKVYYYKHNTEGFCIYMVDTKKGKEKFLYSTEYGKILQSTWEDYYEDDSEEEISEAEYFTELL